MTIQELEKENALLEKLLSQAYQALLTGHGEREIIGLIEERGMKKEEEKQHQMELDADDYFNFQYDIPSPSNL